MATFIKGKIVKKSISLEDKLTPIQKETWQNIKAGFSELKMIDQGKLKPRPVELLLKQLKKES